MSNHQEYTDLVSKLNTLEVALKERIKRCQYLKRKGTELGKINPEQAEAYLVRLHLHKQKMGKQLEAIALLEEKLKLMPRTWIV